MPNEDLRAVLLDVMDEVAPGCLPPVIDDDEDIREQMDLDSMDMLNIVAALHERLNVEIPESDVEQLVTINRALAYLSRD